MEVRSREKEKSSGKVVSLVMMSTQSSRDPSLSLTEVKFLSNPTIKSVKHNKKR